MLLPCCYSQPWNQFEASKPKLGGKTALDEGGNVGIEALWPANSAVSFELTMDESQMRHSAEPPTQALLDSGTVEWHQRAS